MGTTILSFSDRIVIETLRHEKRSLRYIADYLGFSKTTIFNEIHRLKGEYHATSAQADHETKLSYRGRKCSLTVNLKRLIEEKIKVQKWSIEQVAHVVMIAYKTIYNWVDQGLLEISLTDLPDHGIRRKRAKETRRSTPHFLQIPNFFKIFQRYRSAKLQAILKNKKDLKGNFIPLKIPLSLSYRNSNSCRLLFHSAIGFHNLTDNISTATPRYAQGLLRYDNACFNDYADN